MYPSKNLRNLRSSVELKEELRDKVECPQAIILIFDVKHFFMMKNSLYDDSWKSPFICVTLTLISGMPRFLSPFDYTGRTLSFIMEQPKKNEKKIGEKKSNEKSFLL